MHNLFDTESNQYILEHLLKGIIYKKNTSLLNSALVSKGDKNLIINKIVYIIVY